MFKIPSAILMNFSGPVQYVSQTQMQYKLLDPQPPREDAGDLLLPYGAIEIISSVGEVLTLSASDADNPEIPGNVCGIFTRRSSSGFIDGPFIKYRDEHGETDIMPFGQMEESALFFDEDNN